MATPTRCRTARRRGGDVQAFRDAVDAMLLENYFRNGELDPITGSGTIDAALANLAGQITPLFIEYLGGFGGNTSNPVDATLLFDVTLAIDSRGEAAYMAPGSSLSQLSFVAAAATGGDDVRLGSMAADTLAGARGK